MSQTLRLAAELGMRLLNNSGRPLPDFVIIGAQKAGTSSLFEYLIQHPNIEGSFIKEVQFFTRRHWLGERGYRAFFPKFPPSGTLCGEATPYYLFSNTTPERAARLIPQAKIVVLLREPVSRAYSHYKHNTRRGHETRSFEEAIAADLAVYRSTGTLERSPNESEHAYRHHSYIRRGLYADQLSRWLSYFPDNNLYVGKAENFFSDPSALTASVINFLGLPPHPVPTAKAYNQYSYQKRERDEFPDLDDFFRVPNQKLEQLTGITW